MIRARRTDAVHAAMAVLLALVAAAPAAAQHETHASDGTARRAVKFEMGGHATPLLTRVSPMLTGTPRTEGYLSQPTLLGTLSAFGGALHLDATLSLEALTLDRGELGAGAYGEGYVDRRHPHTYAHELMLIAEHDAGIGAGSLSLGRGFAPFGTDDPMMRPFVKFPVNHHLAQILERPVAIVGVRAGPVLVELGVFSGAEPVRATDIGSLDRFGDSWSGRITLHPFDGVELQASHARVESPELPRGGGIDQRKWSASGRYEARHAFGSVYALAEWNRTLQFDRGIYIFPASSVLVEAAVDVRGWRPALRFERADRPEEQRLADPFRTPWPHGDGHILGITRWTIVSARLERALDAGPFTVAPFVEGSLSRVTMAEPGPFNPREFYGSNRIRTVNLGARVRAGWHPPRMGRYGVAVPDAALDHQH